MSEGNIGIHNTRGRWSSVLGEWIEDPIGEPRTPARDVTELKREGEADAA